MSHPSIGPPPRPHLTAGLAVATATVAVVVATATVAVAVAVATATVAVAVAVAVVVATVAVVVGTGTAPGGPIRTPRHQPEAPRCHSLNPSPRCPGWLAGDTVDGQYLGIDSVG